MHCGDPCAYHTIQVGTGNKLVQVYKAQLQNISAHLHYSYNPKQQFTGIIHKQSHILIFIFWYKCSFKSGEKYESFIPSCPESVTCSCFLVFVSVNKQGHIKKNSSFINTLT